MMRLVHLLPRVFAPVIAVIAGFVVAAGETPSEKHAGQSEKTALSAFNSLIGDWRGAGQVRRGSNQGAWTETAAWAWDFENGVALRYDVTAGQHVKTARLTYDLEAQKYQLVVTLPDDSTQTYSGAIDNDKLIVESTPDAGGELRRVTLTQLNNKRTLVLFEKRREAQKSWQRVAEVGYTREGTRLAESESNGPECVVTGGLGTIPVTHNGKTYYVCCSGCKQAFDADPEGVLAEYAARLLEEQK